MMFDRIVGWFSRHTDNDGSRSEECDDKEAQHRQKRRELERRENEARRINDALEGIVHTIQRDRQ